MFDRTMTVREWYPMPMFDRTMTVREWYPMLDVRQNHDRQGVARPDPLLRRSKAECAVKGLDREPRAP